MNVDEFGRKINRIEELIQQNRRYLNNLLDSYVLINDEEYLPAELPNPEDLARAVGNLNAAYEHVKTIEAARLGHYDIETGSDVIRKGWYCVMKHLVTALVQIEEIDESTATIYEILDLLTGGRIRACSACEDDSELDAEARADAIAKELGLKKIN